MGYGDERRHEQARDARGRARATDAAASPVIARPDARHRPRRPARRAGRRRRDRPRHLLQRGRRPDHRHPRRRRPRPPPGTRRCRWRTWKAAAGGSLTDPYGGLATRVGQPERNLLLPGGREVLVSARYVRDAPDRAASAGVVVSLRDTEARRRTERSHAELIATVAHELRSPLTSVKGFTATLLAKWERFTDDQKRLMLETVDADANRVTRLIAELLDISRIDSGRLELRRQPVDIAAAVGRHVQALRRRRPARRPVPAAHRAAAARPVGRPRQDRPGARQPAGKRGAARRGNRHH